MTVPGNLSSPLLATAAAAAAADAGPIKSLRFNSGDSAYLNRTPSSSGNRRTFTFSAWVKRSVLVAGNSPNKEIFIVNGTSNTTHFQLGFRADKLYVANLNTFLRITSAVFRDTSAWYHVVLAVDTTQSTADNRIKLYVNGSQITSFSSSSNPSQNSDTGVNHTLQHNIGKEDHYFDGYMADIYLIDGSALDCTSFGAFDDNGVWQASGYSGTYGTNGFHLDFADSSDLGDDNSGNGNDYTPNNLSGTGAATSSAAVLNLPLNSTPFADSSASSATITNVGSISTTSAATNTFNISTVASLNGSSQRLTTNNNNISFQNNWTLDAYFIIDNGSTAFNALFNSGYGSQTSHYMYIGFDNSNKPYVETSSSGSRTTAANAINKNQWYHMRVIQKSGTITMYINGTSVLTKTAQTTDLSSQGSNTIGSFLDNANNANNFFGQLGPFRIINDALDAPSSGGEATSSGTLANTGTKTVASEIDVLFDVPTNGTQSDTGAGGEVSGNYCTLNPLDNESHTLSNGNLDITNFGTTRQTHSTILPSSGKWYAEFTCNAAMNDVQIGVANNKGTSHLGADSNSWGVISINGNSIHGGGSNQSSYGSSYTTGDLIMVALDLDNGKWYAGKNGTWFNSGNPANGTNPAHTGLSGNIGFAVGSNNTGGDISCNFGQRAFAYTAPSGFKALNTASMSAATIANPSTAFDAKLYTGNASTQSVSLDLGPDLLWLKSRSASKLHALCDSVRGDGKLLYSSSTLAEQDIGATVVDLASNGFNLGYNSGYTQVSHNHNNESLVAWAWSAGANSNKTYTVKVVNDSGNKYRFDDFGTSAVTLDLAEGSTYIFDQSDSSNAGHPIRFGTSANGTDYTTGVTHTGTPGSAGAKTTLVLGTGVATLYYSCANHSGMGGQINTNSTAGCSNFDGSLQSTVKANPEAGFSIVKYTGVGAARTIGHGLINAAPEMIITKARNQGTYDWAVYHSAIGATKHLRLNQITAEETSSYAWNDTAPTNSVFSVANASFSGDPHDYIAYCISPVPGYSAVGSYSGNGTDGFVYTGFRVRFLLTKSTSTNSHNNNNWTIYDADRDANENENVLYPNSSTFENSHPSLGLDLLSNGFALKGDTAGYSNYNGWDYMYLAFASNPFQANGGLAR